MIYLEAGIRGIIAVTAGSSIYYQLTNKLELARLKVLQGIFWLIVLGLIHFWGR